jgi:hypothetical protein
VVWDEGLDAAASGMSKGAAVAMPDGIRLERQWAFGRESGEWERAHGSAHLAWTDVLAFGSADGSPHLAVEAVPSIGWYLALELESSAQLDRWVAILEEHGIEQSLRSAAPDL